MPNACNFSDKISLDSFKSLNIPLLCSFSFISIFWFVIFQCWQPGNFINIVIFYQSYGLFVAENNVETYRRRECRNLSQMCPKYTTEHLTFNSLSWGVPLELSSPTNITSLKTSGFPFSQSWQPCQGSGRSWPAAAVHPRPSI